MKTLALLALAAFLAAASTASGLPAFTTAPKASPGHGDAAELYGAAAGCHDTFDRFVIRARFATPDYDVRYAPRIIADPSGNPVSLQGARRIRARFTLAAGHDNRGVNLVAGTLSPRCPNVLQIKRAGDFEGVVSFGLGLRRMTGFRVFRLTNPTRIVIDVAH